MTEPNRDYLSNNNHNNIKAGRICAIIGIALQVIGLLFYLIIIAFFVSASYSFSS